MSTVEILTDDVREEIHTDDLREENETPNDPGNELRRVSKILNNTSESYRSIVRRVRAATFFGGWAEHLRASSTEEKYYYLGTESTK